MSAGEKRSKMMRENREWEMEYGGVWDKVIRGKKTMAGRDMEILTPEERQEEKDC